MTNYNFEPIKTGRRVHRLSYDGIHYDNKQITFPRHSEIVFKDVNIYFDREKKLIKIEHGNGAGVRRPDKQNRIYAPNMPVPKGRYLRVKDVEVNGAIYEWVERAKKEV